MPLSTYADFRLFAFLLKSFSIVKVYKCTILCQSIGIKEWIRRNLRYTADQKALLVWDSFHGHLTEAVKDLLARRNVDVAVIPGGLAPVLQPLDKCINKPFKNKVRSQYQAWMVNGPFTYTPSGKKRAPSKELVLQWIHKAWQEIPADLVANAFKSCGISNALDATRSIKVNDQQLVSYSCVVYTESSSQIVL